MTAWNCSSNTLLSRGNTIRPVIVGITTASDGARVSLIERVDGSRFEVRVPEGAMTQWEEYAPPIDITEVGSCSDEGEQESAA